MSIVVLGGHGLLGSTIKRLHPEVVALSRDECNILSAEDLVKMFNTYHPTTLINCAGVVPKSEVYTDMFHTLRINGFAPHLIQSFCDNYETRLIHISTDCVYSGISAGEYYEDDIPNPQDMYGMSKYLGEIVDYPHLTIRTSFVGLPDPTKRGLLFWAKNERKVFGYDEVYWNGLTTTELADIIIDRLVDEPVSGILHLYGETITKHTLLQTAQKVFNWDLEIVPESNVREPRRINKTLKSLRSFVPTSKSFRVMLQEMKDHLDDYNSNNH